jgi:hypothetical protein
MLFLIQILHQIIIFTFPIIYINKLKWLIFIDTLSENTSYLIIKIL